MVSKYEMILARRYYAMMCYCQIELALFHGLIYNNNVYTGDIYTLNQAEIYARECMRVHSKLELLGYEPFANEDRELRTNYIALYCSKKLRAIGICSFKFIISFKGVK